MEILALVLIWPLLLLTIGVVFVSASDAAGVAVVFPMIILLVIFLFGLTGKLGEAKKAETGGVEDFDHTRRAVVSFSIALLLPIFVKYLLAMTQDNLATIILGLVLGFGVLVWGMFQKGNKALTYANVLGGIFVIVYLYFQLWSLGQLAQIIASAFGLVAAIVISLVKFREKLS
jgi:hypothetical protein